MCPERFFCPEGTANPVTCPAGYFCPVFTGDITRFPCPAGTFSSTPGLASAGECEVCPAGHYCQDGHNINPLVSPIPCQPGTYNPIDGAALEQNCLSCPAGFACPASGQTNFTIPCLEGHYCPNATVTPDQFPCPPGTFTGQTDLTSVDQCSTCPAGRACDWGTGVTIAPSVPCFPGHVCPAGTPAPTRFPCPPGTFSPLSNLTDVSQCTPCTISFFCLGGGSAPDGSCPPGHVCPVATPDALENPCPAGTFNPSFNAHTISSDCIPCETGTC